MVSSALDPLDLDELCGLIGSGNRQQGDAGSRRDPSKPAPDRNGKCRGCKRRDSGIQDDGGGRVNVVEDRDRQHTACGRACQVGRVQRTCVGWKSRQCNAHNDAGEYKWNGDECESQRGPRELGFRVRRNIELGCKTNGAAQGKEESGDGQRQMRIPFSHDLNENGAGCKAKHGERDRHEGEVIPHGDAENSREKQLEL